MDLILVGGSADGAVLDMIDEISFWGGIDPATGVVIEPAHPRFGVQVSGKVMSMPRGRGSSSASSVLAELLRIGAGPAAIVLGEPDPILAIGSMVAETLYGAGCPVVVSDRPLTDGSRVSIVAEPGRPLQIRAEIADNRH